MGDTAPDCLSAQLGRHSTRNHVRPEEPVCGRALKLTWPNAGGTIRGLGLREAVGPPDGFFLPAIDIFFTILTNGSVAPSFLVGTWEKLHKHDCLSLFLNCAAVAFHPVHERMDESAQVLRCCGPLMMLRACMEMLDNLGVEPENILFDDFG